MTTTYYTAPIIAQPASKRQALANAVQMAINSLEAGACREALLQLAGLVDDVRSTSNPYRLDITGERAAPIRLAPGATLYESLAAVDLASVPVVCTERSTPRIEQAKLARKLFKTLGLKGISVTTPMYSMAQSVSVRIPEEPFPGWVGFEQWQHASYSEMPPEVPAKAARMRHSEAERKVAEILGIAFPNHDDRGDSQSDYSDYCWSIN